MDSHNKAVVPYYAMSKVNEPISLYQGDMKFLPDSTDKTAALGGTGSVEFSWFPEVSLKYRFEYNGIAPYNKPYEHFLELSQHELLVEGICNKRLTGERENYSGQLNTSPVILQAGKINHLIFHLVNFHCGYIGDNIESDSASWRGRISLEALGWLVDIDRFEARVEKRLIDSLRNEGGYAITHSARIQKLDNSLFAPEEAIDVLSALSYFLSFVGGIWVSPILPVGFDSNDNCVWKQWIYYKVSQYKDIKSWFPHGKPSDLNMAFVGFMELWIKPDWKEILQLAIHWYVESNLQSGGVEGAIILNQAAFELLYEFHVSKSPNTNSPPAAKKVRKLLKQSNLPLNYSDIEFESISFKNLVAFLDERRQDEPNIDIPQAIVRIRNGFIHPKREKDGKLIVHNREIRIEAYQISMWYLELVILKLFGYEGVYKNRLQSNDKDDYEDLPSTVAEA